MISRWIPVFERLYPLRILVFPAAQACGWPCSPLFVPRARWGSLPPDFTLESNTESHKLAALAEQERSGQRYRSVVDDEAQKKQLKPSYFPIDLINMI